MLVSMLLFIGYMELLKLTRPPIEEENPVAAEQLDAGPADALEVNGDGAQSVASDETSAQVELDRTSTEEDEDVAPPPEVERYTIGSVDPADGYPMLVTFTNEGAAVERIELSNPRYRDLEDKSAYIGHLAWTDTDGGVLVNVVGQGTPAAKAGIVVGDVITQIGDDAVSSAVSAGTALRKFKYGATVPVQVLRHGQTLSLSLVSGRRPLEVVRPEAVPSGGATGRLQQLSYLLTLHQLGHKRASFDQDEIANLPSLRTDRWRSEVKDDNGTQKIEFRFPLSAAALKKIGLSGSLEVVKRFWLADHSGEEGAQVRDYHFEFEVEFINKGAELLEVGYRIDGPTGLPLEGWWYSYKTHPTSFAGAGVRDVIWRGEGENHQFYTNPMVTKRLKKEPDSPQLVIVDSAQPKKLQYLGVDAQYFNSTILSANGSESADVIFDRVDARALSPIDEQRASRTPITFRADSAIVPIQANESRTFQFEVFAGPKHPDVLAPYNLDECIVYGWFKWPAQLMGFLLHKLHWGVGNYGIAIILLTVLVRGCMFPIGRQQAMNAKKMQELTPEIKKIKEKFPNDTEKQAKAQQELFRKHKYNPLAGCAPMFLQLPIFIGLYRALSVDIELRQTPLIPGLDWCSNLAAPDMLWRWDNTIGIDALTGYAGYLGPFLNLLPMISTGLFLVHQQMFTPPPTDEQQEMQQKVMKFMMLFMLVLFFKVPAGLCLYFITSSLWALAERMLLPKDEKKVTQTPVSLSKAQPVGAGVSGGDSSGVAAATKKKRRKRNKK